jgi:hypothetical protein
MIMRAMTATTLLAMFTSPGGAIDCPEQLGGCARCSWLGYQKGDTFGTCELGGQSSFDPDPGDLGEPADGCYGYRRPPGFCHNSAGTPCPDEFICCTGESDGYWVCDQFAWSEGCREDYWCTQFCCPNEPTPSDPVPVTCPSGAVLAMILHYCE